MNKKIIFLVIFSILAIFCDQSIRRPAISKENNILIGRWRQINSHTDRYGMPLRGMITFELTLNEDLTYSMANDWPDGDLNRFHYIDDGRFYTNNDTLFLISFYMNKGNKIFIFEFNYKNQSMYLHALNENQKSTEIHLLGIWNKFNRFGNRINLDGMY
jgi:hypothetical protein